MAPVRLGLGKGELGRGMWVLLWGCTRVSAARDEVFLLLEKFLSSYGAGMVVPLAP